MIDLVKELDDDVDLDGISMEEPDSEGDTEDEIEELKDDDDQSDSDDIQQEDESDDE